MKGKQLNWQVLLESLIFVLVGVVFVTLVLSGRYLNFVTPRMRPYIFVGGIAFAIIGLLNLRRASSPQYHQVSGRTFLLLVPAVLLVVPLPPVTAGGVAGGFQAMLPGQVQAGQVIPGGPAGGPGLAGQGQPGGASPTPTVVPADDGRLALDPKIQATASDRTVSTTTLPNETKIPPELSSFLEAQKTHPNRTAPGVTSFKPRGNSTSPSGQVSNRPGLAPKPTQDNTGPGKEPGTYISNAMMGVEQTLHGYDGEAKHIEISDKEFYPWLCEMFLHPSRFVDYTITINCQVYKNEKITSPGTFLASRMLMTCCAADVVPTGIICVTDQADAMTNGRWLKIEGKIQSYDYQGRHVPALMATSITDGKQPDQIYVYPYPT